MRMIGGFLIGVVSICGYWWYLDHTTPEKQYHCHGKKFFLMESLEPNGNVFVKTKPERICVDIRKANVFKSSITGDK
jgi:hypothetical protein|tara:strand:- start:169 stop:399 length:231 start_codon:yes stop_codon:yes gene_type:complete